MEVKTFEAYSMRDAIRLVKTEFGKDAVILETTEKRDSSNNRMMYQVTASAANRKSASTKSHFDDSVNDYIFELQKQLTTLTKTVNELSSKMVAKDDITHLQTIVEEVKHLYLSQERPVELSEVESEEIVSVVNQLKLMQVEDTIINELISHLLKVELDSKSDTNNSIILFNFFSYCFLY